MAISPSAQHRHFLKGGGLFFISENLLPDPAWEALRFKPSEMQFPFFSSEPSVLIVESVTSSLPVIEQLLKEVRHLQLQSQVIFINNQLESAPLLDLFNIQKPFRILKTKNLREIEIILREALEKAQRKKQDKVLFELFQEQNKELKMISEKLEERISKRQEHLQDAKEKLFITNKKNSFLQHCLFTIHNSATIHDLEKNLTHLLEESYSLKWFRILFGAKQMTNLNEMQGLLQFFKFPLYQAENEYGLLVFARETQYPFRRDEKDFLEQLCQAVSLCVERILQIDRNNELQSQWQSTFNAILDPVCLIDEQYNIRIANVSLNNKTKSAPAEGKKCYEVLFQRTSPCIDCHRGESFRLRDQSSSAKIYDVFSQTMTIDYQKNYFHLYRDISQQLSFERQLVESAKLAELGSISSSIAHELNNPLGGMINFIQLIKMDIDKNHALLPEILEMEKAATKCKEIVKNLLGFSRSSNENETQILQVEDIIHRAIMITELRTRSLGIHIDLRLQSNKSTLNGRFNHLTQIFCNVLQNAYESILEKRKVIPSFVGQISIEGFQEKESLVFTIVDDGIGLAKEHYDHFFDPLFTTKDPEKHSGLGLTLARQILKEHEGLIELSSQKDGKTCVSIRFPRLSSTP